jgi:hypothetical protein
MWRKMHETNILQRRVDVLSKSEVMMQEVVEDAKGSNILR